MKKIFFLLIILYAKLNAQDIRYFNPAAGYKYFPLTDADGFQRYMHLDTMIFDSLQLASRDTIASMISDSLSNFQKLPTIPPNEIHYGPFSSDEYFTREIGKLRFSGIFDLTFPEGSGKTNANIGNNFNANIGLYNFGLGLQNGKSVTSLSNSFFLGFQNAYSSSIINYSFFNGYRNGLLSPNKIEFTFMNGTENCHKGNSLFSFFNGYRNGFNATNINFSFLNGNRNGNAADIINNSFLNGKENGASAQKIEASFLSGDRNAYKSSEIYRSTLIGNSNAYNLDKLYYSIIIGNSNASNGIRAYKSIYLGFQQGLSNAGDYKLAIGMKKDIALISGEFDTDKVRINGTFEIRDTPSAALDSIYGKTNDDVTRKMAINDLPFVGSSELIDQDSINELDTMYNYDGSILSDGDTVKLPTIADEYTDNLAVTGTSTKTITLGRNIGTDITASFTDNQRTDEQIQDIIGSMVDSNVESGIIVTYNDTSGKLNFSAADPSVTNELQDLDIAELVGTNLRFSLTNDPTVHTISVASLQNSIWSLDGAQAYYNDGVEVRSLDNNYADFRIKTPFQDWEFLVTGSITGGNLRIKPSTNKKLQVASSSTDIFFELDPSDKSLIMDPLDVVSNSFHHVVQNDVTGEFEKVERRRVSYLTTNTTTGASSNTSIYTKLNGLTETSDAASNVTIVGNEWQVEKSGLYKISVTLPFTGDGQSKEYFIGLNRNLNGSITNLGWTKHQLIIDSGANTEVNNDVQHTEFLKVMGPGYKYSIGIRRADSNTGTLVAFSNAVITIEYIGGGL